MASHAVRRIWGRIRVRHLLHLSKGAPIWIWLPFSIGALLLTMFGAFGRKASLERELKKFSEEGPIRILDAIINAL